MRNPFLLTSLVSTTTLLLLLTGLSSAPCRAASDPVGLPSPRSIHYIPEAGGFVCYDGQNRYTRALYGTHSDWRLETSDRPVFAAFGKAWNCNLQFSVQVGGAQPLPLDATRHCVARYEGGLRTYRLTDDRWPAGATLSIAVQPLAEREGALWRFEATGFGPQPVRLTAARAPMANTKMRRNGDLGTDPREHFEPLADAPAEQCQQLTWDAAAVTWLQLTATPMPEKISPRGVIPADPVLATLTDAQGAALWRGIDQKRQTTMGQLQFQTPDPLINTLGSTLMAAADGLWDGTTWLHGCIGWRTPLAGWRGGYVGDVTGWFDRARSHFRAYAASMVTDIPATLPHPAQDTAMHLARSVEKWGTPMYSNGYICKLPNDDRKMSHYDMNLNYIDELLWHFQYDADTALMREMWPYLKLHLEWEKRNFDPDGDHLYDAYCCIWASDALYYNSGAVTHSSAYNYRGNKLIARIAELIGEDPTPYRAEADAILEAMNRRLWLDGQGSWAEFQDFMGKRRIHDRPALWSIYTPIDCGACTADQAYRATRWVDAFTPHIPVRLTAEAQTMLAVSPSASPAFTGSLYTLSTTDWMPYAWSTNNVAHEEVANMALAYFVAGRNDEGYRLLYSDLLDEMCLGGCPGNFGQISHYDKALKEAYRDFGDNIGITSRAIVQGLFGIRPEALDGRCVLQPGFPTEWDSVTVRTPYLSYRYHRQGDLDVYDIDQQFPQALQMVLRVPVGHGLFAETQGTRERAQRLVVRRTSHVAEAPAPAVRPVLDERALGLDDITPDASPRHVYVSLDAYYNADADDIYRQEYLSPRSPYTTLEIPKQGMGDWCVPKMTATLEDDGLRAAIGADGLFDTRQGLCFRLPRQGHNTCYTSLWDNFPESVTVALPRRQQGRYQYAYLMMVGSTNNMQSRIDNGLVVARYADGTADTLHLHNPLNWCAVEQEFYYDDYAFWSASQHPYRVHLGSGLTSRTLKAALQEASLDKGGSQVHVTDFSDVDTPIAKGTSMPDGAAQLLKMPLHPNRKLVSLELTTLSNDVVIGLMGLTLEP